MLSIFSNIRAFLLVVLCLNTFAGLAQIVNIPDANFKNALVNTMCVDPDNMGGPDSDADTNNDGEIQVSEAMAVEYLVIVGQDITDLTGIEAFTQLLGLSCANNTITNIDLSQNILLEALSFTNNPTTQLNVTQNPLIKSIVGGGASLSEIDISQNPVLENLALSSNQLTDIDISNNPQLNLLSCGSNNLQNLDVSNNPNLVTLSAHSNELSVLNTSENPLLLSISIYRNEIVSLDLSQNINLGQFFCEENPLTGDMDLSQNNNLSQLRIDDTQISGLNIQNGNNINITTFSATNNPNLNCIQVDDEAYANGVSFWEKDAGAVYSEDCSLGVDDISLINEVFLYPNPSSDHVFISSNLNINYVEIYSIQGTLVGLEKNTTLIDIAYLSEGIYILQLTTNHGTITKRLIKK